jgi:hypothetical protein
LAATFDQHMEPSRDMILKDNHGDFWWWSHSQGGWVFSYRSEGVCGETPRRGRPWIGTDSIYNKWGHQAFPMTVVGRQVDGNPVWDTAPESEGPEPRESGLQDSGARAQFQGGGVRDASEGKPRFDLLWPEGVPYEDQFLTQVAKVLEMGARKYAERNWELFHTQDALDHAKASLGRHYANYMAGSTDEPHLALMACNLLFLSTIEWKIANGWSPNDTAA